MKNSHLIQQLLKTHKDYMNHISGQCICFKCQCSMMCKCGFKQLIVMFKQNLTSSYEAAYHKNNQKKQDTLLVQHKNIDNVKTLNDVVTKELYKTVKQKDFTEYQGITANPRFRRIKYNFQPNIDYLTSNKVDYQGKQSELFENFESQKKATTQKESKFYGDSTYQNFYKNPQHTDENYDFFTCNKSTIPLKNNFPFTSQSTNQLEYKDSKKPKDIKVHIAPNNIMCLDTIKGMFKSTSQKSFKDLNVKQCKNLNY